jgi:cytochrome c556
MLNQILSTCKQLNRLLKAKDPYHADLVETLLAKIDKAIPSDNPQGVDKDAIVEALNKKD